MKNQATGLTWWMRIVGCFYLLLFVMCAVVRMPIKAEGPPGVLESAAAGDPVANFVIDTWVTLGLLLGVIGAALLIASRKPLNAIALVQTVIAAELFWGIGADLYKLNRGYPLPVSGPWIIIHLVIIATGILVLRKAQRGNEVSSYPN